MSIKSSFLKLNRTDIPLFPRISKNLYFTLFSIFFITTLFFIQKTKAAPPPSLPVDSDIIRIQKAQDKGNNLEGWLQTGLDANLVSVNTLFGGTVPESTDPSLSGYKPGGAIGQITNMTGALFYMPVSGVQYVASLMDNVLGKPAYAAESTGFNGLKPLLPLWSAARNTVYLIISFFFIILGVMIMLRVKISPQAVMNLQNTIPKIVTVLILVTFSYAIAGFVVDLSYLLYGIFLWLLFTSTGKQLNLPLWEPSKLRTIIHLAKAFLSGGNAASPHSFPALFNPGFGDTYYLFSTLVPLEAVNLLGVVIGGLLFVLSLNLIGILIMLIVNIVIFFMMLKFFFGLAKCYVNVLLKIITGPIEIAMGAFPGSKINFGSWVKSLFANVMVFPISLGFIIIIHLFMSQDKGGLNLWAPPGLFGLNNGILNLLVGFVGMTILPAFPTLIPQMITQTKPSPFGQALGQQMASMPIVASGYKAAKSGLDFASQRAIAGATDKGSNWVTTRTDAWLSGRGIRL